MPHVPGTSRIRGSHGRSPRASHGHSGFLAPLAYSNLPLEQQVIDDIVEPGDIPPGTVDGGALSDFTLTAQKFASTLSVPRIEAVLPTLPDADYPEGTIVFLTEDGKLYRNLDDGWTKEVESDDIVSLAADKITAGTLSAALILGGYIATASSGTRVEFDSFGFRAYNGTTLIANIPTDGVSDVYFKAVIQALGLTVTGDATFRGSGNVLEAGAVLTVNEGVSDPPVAPTLATGWAYTMMTGLPGTYAWGGEYNATGGSGGATAVYYITKPDMTGLYEVNASTGAYIRTISLSTTGTVFGVAVLNSYIYVLSGSTKRVDRYSETTGAHDTAYTSITMPTTSSSAAFASDGTYLYILQLDTGTTLKWNKYDSAMVKQGATTSITSSEINDPYDLKVGQFDFGADRMVIVQIGVTSAHVYDLTGTHKTDECFPIQNASGSFLIWNGTNFLTEAGYGGSAPNYSYVFNTHTGWTWAAATSDTVWVAYSWYDSNATGGLHETLVSPKQSITMGRRKRLAVTTPTEPGAGGDDEPNGRRIYVAHNATEPASADMDLQATTADETYYLTSYSSAGAAPPGSNDFGTAGVGEVKSAGGEWSLKGDGTVVMPTPIVHVYENTGSPHTWTKPAGLSHVVVEVVGGGGAGGGSGAAAAGANSKGSGGGAGGYSRKVILAASLGSTETVTVGAGGTGVVTADGNDGGNSSFGTHCTANGGSGGLYFGGSTATFYGGRGGYGGAVGTGDVALAGAPGGTCSGGTNLCVSGNGAPGPWGGGGAGGGSGSSAQGSGGIAAGTTDYGAGGGGAWATSTFSNTRGGGAGAQGVVIVTEFYAG